MEASILPFLRFCPFDVADTENHSQSREEIMIITPMCMYACNSADPSSLVLGKTCSHVHIYCGSHEFLKGPEPS